MFLHCCPDSLMARTFATPCALANKTAVAHVCTADLAVTGAIWDLQHVLFFASWHCPMWASQSPQQNLRPVLCAERRGATTLCVYGVSDWRVCVCVRVCVGDSQGYM